MNRYYINKTKRNKFRLYKFNKNQILIYDWVCKKFIEVTELKIDKYPLRLDIQVDELDLFNIICNHANGTNDPKLYHIINEIYNKKEIE
jgi:hypothetical protein